MPFESGVQILMGKSLCQLHPGADTGERQDFTPPPHLRFQNSFLIALRERKPNAKQESPKMFTFSASFGSKSGFFVSNKSSIPLT